MHLLRRIMSRRVLGVGATLMLWAMMSVPGLADLRIVTQGEDFQQEVLLKDSFYAVTQSDGSHYIINCASGEFSMVIPSEHMYWQGTVDDLLSQLEEALGEVSDSVPGDIFDDFADLFGLPQGPVTVRTTLRGTDTIAGYEATHYHVEYQQNGTWQTHEEIWVSPSLLRAVEAEVDGCVNTVARDVMQTVTSVFAMGFDAASNVVGSDEYLALMEEGYPVRNRTFFQFFGMSFDSTTEVTQVSTDPLSDELFTIPAGYHRIESLRELMD